MVISDAGGVRSLGLSRAMSLMVKGMTASGSPALRADVTGSVGALARLVTPGLDGCEEHPWFDVISDIELGVRG
ncbi:hypothetical protein [Candidatus Chloroploca sp. Khr17]|uniref:hypothetical protein n=1 Tax=Candidatus Chloroploca sp. Khr17 TaxID=2496869 RepID=UPI00101D6498|nr:hypothetical protein [Candidatus Chloroploca sp. Khr17]